jgi:hypothetical protein
MRHRITRAEWLWLPIFIVVALVAFWPAREAGFVTDWLGGQERYEVGTIWDAFRSFDWVAILPVLFVTNFSLYKIFGIEWLPWFLIFTGLHALNGWQLFRLVGRLLAGKRGQNGDWAAVATGFLFLLSPFNVEPIVWKACIQYPLSLFFLLTALHQALRFFENYRPRHAIFINALFLVSIYLTEWNIIWPAIFLLFVGIHTYAHGDWWKLGRRLGWLVLPQVVLLAIWFVLNKIFLGHWVGHYGTGTHLKFDLAAIISTELKYLAKYAGFVRFYEHPVKEEVFGWFNRPTVIWGMAAALALLFVAWLFFLKKMKPRLQWAGFGLAAFFAALLPVSNLFFYLLLWSENDRYGYYASGFFWMAVALILAGLPRWMFGMLLVALLAVSSFFMFKMTRTWSESEAVYQSLTQDFRWYDKDEIIILASPDNLRGVFLMRIIGEPCGFDEALALRRREPFKGKIWEVTQFNMTSPNDGIKVEKLDSDSTGMTYKVRFAQDGNWWWRDGIGAGELENEVFIYKPKEWHVEVTLKEKHPNHAVIYPVGGKWLEAPQ